MSETRSSSQRNLLENAHHRNETYLKNVLTMKRINVMVVSWSVASKRSNFVPHIRGRDCIVNDNIYQQYKNITVRKTTDKPVISFQLFTR